MACPTTVHDNVCVEAEVTITPNVTVGDIRTVCIGGPIFGGCPGTTRPTCTFEVGQRICVQIPLTFSADAIATPTGIICGDPDTGNCPTTTACTLTRGFFANHEAIVAVLLAAAGGSITLGIDAQGLSLTVDTLAEAITVLQGNAPLPATVTDPNLIAQYRALYAQLLTAQLNVLNGATCPYITTVIGLANTFLATSLPTGSQGAPAYTQALDLFNSGDAPGCPEHCASDI